MQSTKGKEWTENEHKLFLLGLEKYDKGDWKGISREFVKSRTPSQVASHAQKFFLRLKTKNTTKKRLRSSIHDITHVDPEDALALLGQVASPANNVAQVFQTHAIVATSVAGSYSTGTGQPIDGPLAFGQHLSFASENVPGLYNPNVGSYNIAIGQPIDGPPSFDEHLSFANETAPGLCELSEEDLDDIISRLYEPTDERMFSLLNDFNFAV